MYFPESQQYPRFDIDKNTTRDAAEMALQFPKYAPSDALIKKKRLRLSCRISAEDFNSSSDQANRNERAVGMAANCQRKKGSYKLRRTDDSNIEGRKVLASLEVKIQQTICSLEIIFN